MMIRDLPDEERPREKMARLGPAALDNPELIALFLRTGVKGRSAVQIARDLLREFGSLHAIAAAGLGSLRTRHGLGLAKAAQLAAAFEIGSRLARESLPRVPLDCPERIYDCFAPQLAHLPLEKLIVALVNSRLDHIGTHEISSGTLTETSAHPRELLRPAILHQAFGIVIIHNHPSGDPTPSNADTRFTRQIIEATEVFQIRLLDHVIIGRPSPGQSPYFSFREHSLI
jgi:DNA repair protein RadC